MQCGKHVKKIYLVYVFISIENRVTQALILVHHKFNLVISIPSWEFTVLRFRFNFQRWKNVIFILNFYLKFIWSFRVVRKVSLES